MLKTNTLTAEMAAYLWTLLDGKAVGLVLGVTGSGKTTLLSAMISMINPRWRILTIEDTLELQIPHADWVRLNTRKSYGMLSDKFDISIRDMIDISLTQKPDYEIIGEIRVKDMDSLFQSVGTGHGGLTSFHASTPIGAITRMRGNHISDGELALLWFTTHSARVRRDKQYHRKVTNISEITASSSNEGKLNIQNIYQYDILKDRFDRVLELQDSQRYKEALAINGIDDGKKDIEKRIQLLKECVQKNAVKVSQVFEILGKYYE
jgi:flagellar protein FlaI